jgi:hypothetical protein
MMEAYYQKKQACKQVMHTTKQHSEYGEEDTKVDFMEIEQQQETTETMVVVCVSKWWLLLLVFHMLAF